MFNSLNNLLYENVNDILQGHTCIVVGCYSRIVSVNCQHNIHLKLNIGDKQI